MCISKNENNASEFPSNSSHSHSAGKSCKEGLDRSVKKYCFVISQSDKWVFPARGGRFAAGGSAASGMAVRGQRCECLMSL